MVTLAREEKLLIWAKGIEEQGFGIIPNVLAQQDVEDLLEELSLANLPRSRAGVRHAMRLATVRAMARGSQLLGVAQQILGNGAFPFRATLFDKSPTANWLVVWHQDTALPLRERHESPGWGPWSVKDDVFMHTLQRMHCRKCSPCGCTWTTQLRKMAHCASCPKLIRLVF